MAEVGMRRGEWNERCGRKRMRDECERCGKVKEKEKLRVNLFAFESTTYIQTVADGLERWSSFTLGVLEFLLRLGVLEFILRF